MLDGSKLTQEKAAHALGWSGQSAVEQYLNGRIALDIKAGIAFARLLRTDIKTIEPEWSDQIAPVSSEDADDRSIDATNLDINSVRIPYYPEVRASAGHGCVPLEEANITMLDMAKSFLAVNDVKPGNAVILQASGDSMTGQVEHGDMLLVDCGNTDIVEGRIYIVSFDGELYVKKIQRLPGKKIRLMSTNPTYDSITLSGDCDDTVKIIGRVVQAWQPKSFI